MNSHATTARRGILLRFSENRIGYLAVLVALGIGIMTIYQLSQFDPVGTDSGTLTTLIVIDLIAVVIVGGFVIRQILRLWVERRQKMAGYQLHWRLALLFGGVAALPAVITTAFALFVVDYSLRGWFADRISTAVTGSVQVADSYFEEHSSSIRSDVLTIANDVNREAFKLLSEPNLLNQYLTNQAALRNLSEAIILDGTGQVVAKSRFAFAVTFTSIGGDWLTKARQGEVVILRGDQTNKLRAAVKLNSFVDAYLFVGRFIDRSVLEAVDSTRLAAADYQQLGISQLDLQVSFAFVFGLILALLLITALWIGLNLATAIVEPLGSVISVAEQVRDGNLSERVPEGLEVDEIARLGLSFNNMLDELTRSREQLVQANMQIDRRREFTEAVLSGVSSGVIGLDKDRKVTLPNMTACQLLQRAETDLIGNRLEEVVPEFASLISSGASRRRKFAEEQILLTGEGKRLTLRARIATEKVDGRVIGYVVTFDDVTDLLAAQRKAAWSDIARRIAHEIKNPLTPIQLAADRLRRKYKPDDEVASEQFSEYLSIIGRQVDDIGRMVDEFSAFARMPQPVMQPLSLRELAIGQVALFEGQGVAIEASLGAKDVPAMVIGDAGLLRQALTNIIQNAMDSLGGAGLEKPRIDLELTSHEGVFKLAVTDNGPGFPDIDRARLVEPYVTKRDKGTGLGLAIVSKIVQDHGGELELQDAKGGGARVVINLPQYDESEGAS
ncbi:MAG: PAS domain-containing sensor histidine kinase [Pseudomonadota bacterium]|nr:PAS domain-containing sensor histidine kinase [Pseudomonadota bacterium]MEC7852511.1 PAS domain-containing sensor histidine kinase [Pseudomonadota bacterium]MEC8711907.1 PAS domain-containing sensor histidine kinase [Pseudomonadota bacterium]MED5305652.1 PAS domain-containing sensor histidine kinase [Pseudomonadota bacterium]MED5313982.1 PAS domain-containing sensor histidine kinase [Pseudomonadota bacterium]